MDDAALLSLFRSSRDADAFAAIVRGHRAMVFAAARRQVRDASLAEDVTQAVFIVLARKAGSVDPRYLAGWLLGATRLACKDALRKAARRAVHERNAAIDPQRPCPAAGDAEVEAIRSVVDEAMSRLGDLDRSAVALRFFEGRSLAEVGRRLGLSEEAARKRIARSIGKLRGYLTALGVTPSAAALGSILEPSTVGTSASAEQITAAAMSAGSTGSSNFIATGVIRTMLLTKTQLAACVLAGTSIVGVAAWQGVQVARAAAYSNGVTAGNAVGAAEPAGNTAVAKLENGVSVELLGVASDVSALDWWAPDGGPIDGPQAELTGVSIDPDDGYMARKFAIQAKLDTDTGERAGMTLEIPGSRGWATNVREDHWGTQVDSFAAEIPAGKPATLRMQIAAGKWEVRAEGDGRNPVPRAIGQSTVLLGTTIANDGGTDISVTLSGPITQEQLRVVAATANAEVVGVIQNRMSANDTEQLVYQFPNVDQNSVLSVRVESRPYNQWIEFREVSTEAGKKTRVLTATSDQR